MDQSESLQRKLQGCTQYAESVFHAAAKVDGRGLLEILCGTGDFTDAETEVHALGQHLIVEDEVVGIFQQRQVGEHFAAEGAVSGVVLGKLYSQKKILEGGKQPVGNVFVDGHAAEQSAAADDARSQHDVINIVSDHARHGGDQQRRVLIVGVEHDDDVGARREGLAVAGLLVASVAIIAVVLEDVQAKAAGKIHSLVGAGIVGQK